MKKLKSAATLLMVALTLTACQGNDDLDDLLNNIDNNGSNPSGASSGTMAGATSLVTLTGFDINTDTSAIEENETMPPASDTYYEDYVEGFVPTAVIQLAFDGDKVTVSGEADDVTITTTGGHVTVNASAKNVCYRITGSTADGSLKIYSEKKFEVILDGVSITNPQGAAINNQGKRMYLVLADGTKNTLCDGATYQMTDGEDQKGTLFSEGKLALSGKGSLEVTALGKNGIVSDDYILFRPGINVNVVASASNGIKSNDGIIIRGGVLNVSVSAASAKAITTDGHVLIEGGRTTLITTGNTAYDSDDKEYKGCTGLKTDSIITMTGGELLAKSTGGGGKAVKCDQGMTVSGGTIRAIAMGKNSNNVSAKAIKVDGDLLIEGGDIMARATSHEAIETKGKMTVEAGSVATYSSDDAINSAKDMTINGGHLFGCSTGNDGIDTNGNLTINGGLVIGIGTTSPEEGIDAAEGKTLAINGGTVVGIGGGGEALSGSQQKAAIKGVTVTQNAWMAVNDTEGDCILALLMPRSYSGATLQVSSPKFKNGETYTLVTAGTATGNDAYFGFLSSPVLGNATQLTSFTTSQSTSGGMGGHGGFPGWR